MSGYYENGSEIIKMTKEEADASVEEMGKMVDYFYGKCECGKLRKDCDCYLKNL